MDPRVKENKINNRVIVLKNCPGLNFAGGKKVDQNFLQSLLNSGLPIFITGKFIKAIEAKHVRALEVTLTVTQFHSQCIQNIANWIQSKTKSFTRWFGFKDQLFCLGHLLVASARLLIQTILHLKLHKAYGFLRIF